MRAQPLAQTAIRVDVMFFNSAQVSLARGGAGRVPSPSGPPFTHFLQRGHFLPFRARRSNGPCNRQQQLRTGVPALPNRSCRCRPGQCVPLPPPWARGPTAIPCAGLCTPMPWSVVEKMRALVRLADRRGCAAPGFVACGGGLGRLACVAPLRLACAEGKRCGSKEGRWTQLSWDSPLYPPRTPPPNFPLLPTTTAPHCPHRAPPPV